MTTRTLEWGKISPTVLKGKGARYHNCGKLLRLKCFPGRSSGSASYHSCGKLLPLACFPGDSSDSASYLQGFRTRDKWHHLPCLR